jgi:imidazolonepropionase-like amidohydrolase
MTTPRLTVLLTTLIAGTALAQGRTAVTCGHVFDSATGTLRGAATLILDGERISEVRDGLATAGSDQVVDLSQLTCLPGFIDAHTHLMMETGPKAALERTRLNGADYAYRSTMYARRTLMAGFTTVRNLGDHGGQD